MLPMLADNLERIGNGMTAFSSGLVQIRSITAELNAAGKEGFLAVSSDGAATSMVVGSGDLMKNFVDGKIAVDVNIPEMKIPKTEVHVYIDGKKMEGMVKKIVSRS